MIRFAYSTNAYTLWPLDKAIRDIQTRGFEGIEILADIPHAFPSPSLKFPAIVDALKETGLAISNLNGNTSLGLDRTGRDPGGFWPSFLDADPAVREMKVSYVRSVIDLARRLGAWNVCTASGRLPKGMTRGAASAHAVESLAAILEYAAQKPKIRVGLEYEPGFFLGDMKSTLEILEAVDHPLLGVNLDLGHAWCMKEDLEEVIETFGDRIWNMHAEDIRKRIHDHLVPGRGDIDFKKVKAAIGRIKYKRFVTLELYPYKKTPGEAGEEGLKYLKQVMA